MLLASMKYHKNGTEMKKNENLGFCENTCRIKELKATSAKFFVSVAIFSLE
jgi:hypothetical protein